MLGLHPWALAGSSQESVYAQGFTSVSGKEQVFGFLGTKDAPRRSVCAC